MIFLWNGQRVLSEVVELARLKISKKSGLPMSRIKVRIEASAGGLNPIFDVDAKGEEEEEALEAVKQVWADVYPKLIERLKGMGEKRHGCP